MDLTPVDRSVLAACAFGASEDQIVRIIVGPQPEPVPLELRMAAMKSIASLIREDMLVFRNGLYWLPRAAPTLMFEPTDDLRAAVEQTFQADKLSGDELAAVSLSEKVKALFADDAALVLKKMPDATPQSKTGRIVFEREEAVSSERIVTIEHSARFQWAGEGASFSAHASWPSEPGEDFQNDASGLLESMKAAGFPDFIATTLVAIAEDANRTPDHFVEPNEMVPDVESASPDHSPDARKMTPAAEGSGPNTKPGIITGIITFAEGPGSPDCICAEIDSSNFDPPLTPLSDHFRAHAEMMPGVHLGPPPEGKPLGGHIGPAPEPVPLSEGYSEAEEVPAPDDGSGYFQASVAAVAALVKRLPISTSDLPEDLEKLPLQPLEIVDAKLYPPFAAAIEQAEREAPPQHQVTGDFTVDFAASANEKALLDLAKSGGYQFLSSPAVKLVATIDMAQAKPADADLPKTVPDAPKPEPAVAVTINAPQADEAAKQPKTVREKIITDLIDDIALLIEWGCDVIVDPPHPDKFFPTFTFKGPNERKAVQITHKDLKQRANRIRREMEK